MTIDKLIEALKASGDPRRMDLGPSRKLYRDAAQALASSQEEIERLSKALETIRDYPPITHARRDDEGYPMEIVYDEFAYKRIVDSYRKFASDALAQPEHGGRR